MSESLDLDKLAEEATRKAEAGEVMSAQEAFIASLPAHIRRQIELGVIDNTRIPMEDLMRIAREAAADGEALEGATLGDTHNPLDYAGRLHAHGARRDSQQYPEISPPEDPGEQNDLEAAPVMPDAQSANIHGSKKKKRLSVKHVDKKNLGTLSPNTASGAPAGRDKGKDGLGH